MAMASGVLHVSPDQPTSDAPRGMHAWPICTVIDFAKGFVGVVRHASIWRTYDASGAAEDACDLGFRHLTAPGARLDPNAVRWDLIGTATSGRRCRIEHASLY